MKKLTIFIAYFFFSIFLNQSAPIIFIIGPIWCRGHSIGPNHSSPAHCAFVQTQTECKCLYRHRLNVNVCKSIKWASIFYINIYKSIYKIDINKKWYFVYKIDINILYRRQKHKILSKFSNFVNSNNCIRQKNDIIIGFYKIAKLWKQFENKTAKKPKFFIFSPTSRFLWMKK